MATVAAGQTVAVDEGRGAFTFGRVARVDRQVMLEQVDDSGAVVNRLFLRSTGREVGRSRLAHVPHLVDADVVQEHLRNVVARARVRGAVLEARGAAQLAVEGVFLGTALPSAIEDVPAYLRARADEILRAFHAAAEQVEEFLGEAAPSAVDAGLDEAA